MAAFRKNKTPEKKQSEAPKTSSGVFFGALRSEFDTPESLSSAFTMTNEAFEKLMNAYRSGKLDPQSTALVLSRMILTDRNGLQWTVGATTRRWYRRLPGGAWSSALPPAQDDDELSRTAALAVNAANTALETAASFAPPSAPAPEPYVAFEPPVEPATASDDEPAPAGDGYGYGQM